MQDQAYAVTETAACTTARHALCRGTVYTLTTGLGSPATACTCPCHTPDDDQAEEDGLVLDYDEIEDLPDREADRLLADDGVWS